MLHVFFTLVAFMPLGAAVSHVSEERDCREVTVTAFPDCVSSVSSRSSPRPNSACPATMFFFRSSPTTSSTCQELVRVSSQDLASNQVRVSSELPRPRFPVPRPRPRSTATTASTCSSRTDTCSLFKSRLFKRFPGPRDEAVHSAEFCVNSVSGAGP